LGLDAILARRWPRSPFWWGTDSDPRFATDC